MTGARIILVTGGRDFTDQVRVTSALDGLLAAPDLLIQGGAKGADRCALEWARTRGVHPVTVEALWDFYKKPAGHKRNEAMLWLRPALCVAFPGGRGTDGMVDLCVRAGIPVWAPYGVAS